MAKKFATADCETDPFKYGRIPEPFLWGFYSAEEGYLEFNTTEKFIEFIQNYEGIVYFHNGGKFDCHFLFNFVEPQDKVMVVNGRLAKFKIGKCEIRDSYMLFPQALSAYKKDDIDYNIMEKGERDKKENKKKISNYMRGDCVYLYELLVVQFETYGNKLTLASSAFSFWNTYFNPYKKLPKTTANFFEIFKPFYYGGRVQCFKKGIINENFKVFDIRSAYPFAMLQNHPYGTQTICGKDLPDGEDWGLSFIKATCISKGALPFRDEDGIWAGKGTLNFFNDDIPRKYFATGWEFKKAMELGLLEIKEIHQVITFQEKINFSGYVNHFYKLKSSLDKNKNPAEYILAKLYLNSLYGKFGQSSLDHMEYSIINSEDIEGYLNEGYTFDGIMGNLSIVSCPIPKYKQNFYNVATAASVTGYVRAYLMEHIANASNPIYCDTDSLACSDFNGIIGEELGNWEFEGDFEKGAIGGKKLYAFKYKEKEKYKISSKGAKLSANEIFSIAKGETILYKNIAPTFSVGKKEPTFIERTIRMT